MYTRILAAVGGSPWSNSALTYAVEFAGRLRAELHILTVLTAPVVVEDSRDEPPVGLMRSEIEKAAQELLDEAGDLARQAGVAYATHAMWGAIPLSILNTASEAACDVIIMGTRRDAGQQREKLGYITHTITANAPQPVLVVKRPLAPEALIGQRVLVATGGTPWSDYAVEHALGLAQMQGLGICVLHVSQGQHSMGSDPDAAFVDGQQILERAEAWSAAAGVAYEGVLASGSVPEVILETAIAKACSAIILGTRSVAGWSRLNLGQIIDTVATRSTLPVLIVKPYGAG